MIIYIGNLPGSATQHGLCSLARLSNGGQACIFKKQGHNGSFYRYALLTAATDRFGEKSISYLQGKRLEGNVLEVREFKHRIAGNERRRLDWRAVPWQGEERRLNDRRRADG